MRKLVFSIFVVLLVCGNVRCWKIPEKNGIWVNDYDANPDTKDKTPWDTEITSTEADLPSSETRTVNDDDTRGTETIPAKDDLTSTELDYGETLDEHFGEIFDLDDITVAQAENLAKKELYKGLTRILDNNETIGDILDQEYLEELQKNLVF